jgi:asparagine synthase (glutamine-hydrolysing)
MCGIAGCFGTKDEKTINKMLDALGHRGPNDRGIHSFGNKAVFGHTRLSIVDVAKGHQPLLAEDGQWVSFAMVKFIISETFEKSLKQI